MERASIYMGRILVVDLQEGRCEQEELTEELIEEHIGGVAFNVALYERFRDRDPVIVGTGPLTGTFAPASCAGVVTARSPATGGICHVPLLWQTAVEVKYSGFDFVVFLGESARPVRLWLHDELAELADAGSVWGKDVWETTDKLRFEHGDDYVQVLGIGPAGERQSLLGQLSENYWGSRDLYGLGALWGKKKLKALAARGLGTLEVQEGFFDACVSVKGEIASGRIRGVQGLVPILRHLGADAAGLKSLESRVHRNAASFNCPYPYNTFLMIEEEAALLKESSKLEPGILLTDPAGVASLLFLGDGMPTVLRRINRLGLEPSACGVLLAARGVRDAAQAEGMLEDFVREGCSLEGEGVRHVRGVAPWPLLDNPESRLVQAASLFSHALPPQPALGSFEDFSVPVNPQERARWWLERQAVCLLLGLCPLSALLSPELSLERMSDLAAKACQWDDLTPERLRNKAWETIGKSRALSRAAGKLPLSWQGPEFEASLEGALQAP